MAEDIPSNVQGLVDAALNDGAPTDKMTAEYEPIYKVYADSKIPVSKSHGALWKSRLDQITAKRRDSHLDDMYDETTRYYRNDQSGNKLDISTPSALIYSRSKRARSLEKGWTITENIVFSNVSALVPTLYAKNPDASITPNDTNDEDKRNFFKMCEKLVDVLAVKKDAPGLNLRIKGKKGTVHAALYNIALMEIGYVQKASSSEQAMADITELSQKLASAKTTAEVQDIEGKLQALEDTVDLLSPSGPWAKLVDPRDLFIDPDAQEPDFSDAKFMIRRELLRTAWINAKFATKNEKGEYVSIYEPTHVMKAGDKDNAIQEDINDFTLFKASGTERYGYDELSYDKACLTMCYWVWDKVTRRLLLYADNCWKYPVWVWDDPYELPDFFPFFPMFWLVDPIAAYAKSEISYYLDQQDEINSITSERKRMRDWASGKVVFNKNVVKNTDDIDKLIKGDSKVLGLDLPVDADITKVISSLPAPSTQYERLFDTSPILQSVDRLSSVTAVQRGAEYKTNTTNKAIEAYNSQTQTRADEKIDSIEEWIGDILNAVLFLCLRFMPQEQVATLIGEQEAQLWQNFNSTELRAMYSVRCVGGSSQKPTSAIKKQQTLQLAQVLGQFASTTPVVGVVALKMIERAFADDVNITDQEWQLLTQSMQQGGEGNPDEILNKLDQALQQLPPEAKAALGKMIASGMPLKEAMAQIAQMTGSQQQRPNPQQQQVTQQQ